MTKNNCKCYITTMEAALKGLMVIVTFLAVLGLLAFWWWFFTDPD